MVNVFVTGASGYIGGQVLHDTVRTFPDYKITILERHEEKAAKVKAAYPKVNVLIGGLDDAEVVEREASNADVLLNFANAKHLPGVEAIHKGLRTRSANGPVFWVQVSGATLLAAGEIGSPSFEQGSSSSTVFDDVDEIAALKTHIKAHPERTVDNYMQTVPSTSPHVHAAVLVPPIIYGIGQGAVNTRSIQVPDLVKTTLKRGKGLQLGKGENAWGDIHVRDLGNMVVALLGKAAEKDLSKEIWGENGVYLASVGEMTFGQLGEKIALAAKEQLYIADSAVESLPAADFEKEVGLPAALFGTNARARARRAEQFLGWKPSEHGLGEEARQCVTREAEGLGLQTLPTI